MRMKNQIPTKKINRTKVIKIHIKNQIYNKKIFRKKQ